MAAEVFAAAQRGDKVTDERFAPPLYSCGRER
jgi:hypothetical protein